MSDNINDRIAEGRRAASGEMTAAELQDFAHNRLAALLDAAEKAERHSELLARLKLLATNVRKVYGRSVLRSCGVDDMDGEGITLANCEPGEFDRGTILPPSPHQLHRSLRADARAAGHHQPTVEDSHEQ